MKHLFQFSALLSAALLFFVPAAGERRANAASDYYAAVTASHGEELLGQLHDLVTTTHTHYTSYSECRDNAHTTDFAEGGEKSVIEFYTHETIVEYTKNGSDAGRWNREHVWPKSLSNGLWGTEGGGSDMHHIRPSEVKMNSQRGNDKFGEVEKGGEVYSKATDGKNSQLGGHRAGGVFEPLDEAKGDAARIVFYVYLHYNTYSNVFGTTNGKGQESYFGTLRFTDIVSAKDEAEAVALLLEWNALDPVDAIETTRNEAVCSLQGNRNPFIDHPEYAEAIWGEPVDPEPVEPVDPDPVEPDPVDPEPVDPDPVDPDPVDPEPTDPEPAEKGGCGGVIGGTDAALLTVAAAAAALLVRRRG